MTAVAVVAVVFKGQIEVPRKGKRLGYRWVDGYSVTLNGRETQPWLQKRAALALARKILPENEELGEPEKGAMRFGRSRR